MPELPEIEHVVETLRRYVCGDVIERVSILRPALIRPLSPARFRACVCRRTIEHIRRRGKFILMDLSGGSSLLIHLRMTGGFAYGDPRLRWPKTTRLIFHLRSGRQLGFTDTRNLGTLAVVQRNDVDQIEPLDKLGVEPLAPDFTADCLKTLLRSSGRSIKEFLLDQTKVVGLGNIYAAEVLHRAGLSPIRSARSVARSAGRLVRLHQCIVETLREALHAQAAGQPLHLELIGEPAAMNQPRCDVVFQVYNREGQPCFTCGQSIRRLVQSGRSTYYCPRCQT
ncbi:MAG: bifunctional DNA-formamidopyrimidine glycosylase/DNA-(apurinic or apyrimidinic site) lyase [Acidobacteriota bacterium]|nr:bifunctional DNA-formamidopyrimidine glycosylase/DNA-(apurinic or apyrimidinic site) lyase [Blastocatellia bacterium]MDW8238061.1 bifunctional DNA-formamidopyrimidine glycosylase/DNA-(apurinic or apyrimidinic site) lyase [Acidobacteriota bacterium]